MDKVKIKEEYPLSDDIASTNQQELFHEVLMNVPIKTEIISETPFTSNFVKKNVSETVTCGNSWEINCQTETGQQTVQKEAYDPLMKDKKYELHYKTEIKEEPWYLEIEASSVCDDMKDRDFPPEKCSRLLSETVSDAISGHSPLTSADASGRDTTLCDGMDHLESTTDLLSLKKYVLSEETGKFINQEEMYMQPLCLKQKILHHKGKGLYKCNICTKNFTYLSRLKIHALVHEGKKPYKCKTCNKSFTQLSTLRRHNLIHEDKKPYQCKICNKSFIQSSNLKAHYLIHEGKRPYQCEPCDKSFTQMSHLKTHNLIHESKKVYQCNTCNKTFIRSSDLKIHNFIHEGKKPYSCKTCDKSFNHWSTLKKHNLIHEGKKPFLCETCNKSFSISSNLKRHILIHEGEKPFQCKTCNKSFNVSSNLKRHNLTHESKKP